MLRGESAGCGPPRTIYTNVVMERRREAHVRPGERQALLSGRAQSHPQGARASGQQGQGRMNVPRSERSCSWSSGWGTGPRWNFPAGMAESGQDEALSTDAVVCSDIFRLSVE